MNKKLLAGVFSAFMAMAPLCGNAAQTIDAPHLNVGASGTEACTQCHFANYQPGDCIRCHLNAAEVPNGALVTTHKNLNCQACHNPHVSLQPTGITGNFSGVSADTPSVGMTTLTGVTPTPNATWAAKTSAERGLILWVDNSGEKASYEIKGVDAAQGTVTVKGNVPATSVGSFDLRRGQLIAKKLTKDMTSTASYRTGDLAVQFPSQGSTSIFIDTVNSPPTGVCQVCHTTTAYWKSDGSGATHNADQVCTDCHKHAAGFLVTGCTSCHGGADPGGAPTSLAELAKPATGSQTAGQHAIHATATGYNFPCVTCHTGTGMDLINNPTNPVKGDGLQIGFSIFGKYLGYLSSYNGQASVTVPYVGTNHTTVTNSGTIGNGSLTCGTVYCHSNGKSVRLGCTTALPNTSPAWDGSSADPQGDTVKCNNCHGFEKGKANTMASGRHGSHVGTYAMACSTCHADTVALDGLGSVVISNKANHVNGSYDIKGSGTYAGNPIVITYDKTTHTCSVATCHPARTWTANDTETCPNPCTDPASMVNIDPVVSWNVSNIDDNTLKVADTSFDADSNDPVKNKCQGGGYLSTLPGLTKFSHPDALMGNYVAVTWMKGPGSPADPVVRTYRASAVDNVTDPSAPRLWFNYRAIDNGPNSWNNSFVVGTVDGDGFNDSGWTAHIITPVDLATVNIQPNLDFDLPTIVRTGANTCTMTINDKTLDLDYNDAAKAALFGGGHDGSAGRGRLMFNNPASGVDTGALPITFTTVPSNTPVSTTVYGASGTVIWYQYFVFDNHYLSATARANSPSYQIYSGWKSVTLP